MWAQADNRDPRTVRNSLTVSSWSMEKSNLESPEKTALSLTERKATGKGTWSSLGKKHHPQHTVHSPGHVGQRMRPIYRLLHLTKGQDLQRKLGTATKESPWDCWSCTPVPPLPTGSKDLPLHLHAQRSSTVPSPPTSPDSPRTHDQLTNHPGPHTRARVGVFLKESGLEPFNFETCSGVASKRVFLKVDFKNWGIYKLLSLSAYPLICL